MSIETDSNKRGKQARDMVQNDPNYARESNL